MKHKADPSTKARSSPASRPALLLAGAAALVVFAVFVISPAVDYTTAARRALEGDDLAAYELYDKLGEYRDSQIKCDDCLRSLCSGAVSERDYGLFDEYYALIKGERARADARGDLLATADSLYGAGLYEAAFDCFSALSGDADAADGAERSREARYNELAAEYAKRGQVPDGFESAMLAGYKDADKYALLRELQRSAWLPNDSVDEVALLYSLGGFLDLRDKGFIVQRLYGKSYSNANGYYFKTELGDWAYNLPHKRYYGYYGLYSKLDGNVLLTGSDEKKFWVEQFRFSFADYDRTLNVYCYATDATITLTLDE